MAIAAINVTNTIASGYALFEGLTGSGQLNIYERIQEDLAIPFAARSIGILEPKPFATIKGYMISLVTEYEPLALSKFEGYPARFNFGSYRYLQNNRAMGSPRYIDTIQWGDILTQSFFVLGDEDPASSFPPSGLLLPTIYSLMVPLSSYSVNYSVSLDHVASDGFAFSLNSGVEMSFAFLWSANIQVYSQVPFPTIYFLNI